MQYFYAPWRSEYHTNKDKSKCVFCDISQTPEKDRENKVLFRDEICFIVMNLYPYNPGHFMVVPHRHLEALEDLPPNEWQHIANLAQKGVKLLKEEFRAQGVNIGMNLGAVAGAGISDHIHLHLIPRFFGDTNFITTIAKSRVFGSDFCAIYEKLLAKSSEYFG